MIIEARSSQQQKETTDPRKKFEFDASEKPSRLPTYLALIFTGIAAYIKSAFPTAAQDAGSDGSPRLSPAASAPRHHPSQAGAPGVDPVATDGIEEEKASHPASQPALKWDAGFVLPDPIAFHYTAVSIDFLGPHVAPFFPAAVNYRPHNDNIPAVAASDPTIAGQAGWPSAASQPARVADPADDIPPPPKGDDDGKDRNASPPANRAPTVLGPVRLNDVFAGQVVLIGLSQWLLGASDPDDDVLTINDLAATGGTLVQVGSNWLFAAGHGTLGTVTFTYQVSDGLLSAVQTATVEVTHNGVRLASGDDIHTGTPWDDDIDALSGNDIIDAGAGNDSVMGGPGDDHINGGDGDDQLFGNDGDDIIFGGRGDDFIVGGAGNDQLYGEEGNDIMAGSEGNDFLSGGQGNDSLEGGPGSDTLQGDAGDDTISGGEGDDTIDAGEGEDTATGDAGDDHIDGGSGNDTLRGGAGNDILLGGNGDDRIYGDAGDDLIAAGEGDDEIDGGAGDDRILGDAGCDRIDGGAGFDVLDYSGFTANIHLDLAAGIALSDEIDEDFFDNIEKIIGGQGDDTFIFGDVAAIVAGGDGDDLFIFTMSEPRPELSHQLVFGILDFVAGDRIHVADYEISRQAERLEEERFGDVYDAMEDGFEDGLPIRVTYAYYDDMDHTIIEADVDRDDFYDISITLDGVQLPLAIGNHLA